MGREEEAALEDENNPQKSEEKGRAQLQRGPVPLSPAHMVGDPYKTL